MPIQKEPTPKGVRNLDPNVWRRLRIYAIRIGEPIGEVVNQALRAFLKDKKIE